MLLLTRQAGQTVTLQTSDGPITVTVVEVANTYEGHYIQPRVRLGIKAPKTVVIHRDDIKKATATGVPVVGVVTTALAPVAPDARASGA